MGNAGVQGQLQSLGIHPGEHQNFTGLGVLTDGRHQPVGVKLRGDDLAPFQGELVRGDGEARHALQIARRDPMREGRRN